MKDKKVILINRPLIRVKGFHILSCKWQTLNLAYIAAILEKKKIICKIIDARALELTVKSVVQCVKKFQPDLVIFDTEPFDFYQCPNPNWETINKSIKGIKNVVEAKILSLGPQATLFDKKLMSKLPIDFILKGDNPFLVAEVALDILRYNNTKHIGVSYFDNGKFIFGKTIHLTNLSILPMPAYHLLPMRKYSSNMKIFPIGNFSVVISARGCPFHCKYCFKGMINNLVRTRDLNLVIQEIDILINNYKIKTVYFINEIFSFNRKRVIYFCQRLIDSNYDFKWVC